VSLSPYMAEPPSQRLVRWGVGVAAVALLGFIVVNIAVQPVVQKQVENWVEVVVQKAAPPPPPPPPPPEAPKPKPKPQAVKFEDMKTKPTPNQPPPEAPKPVRRVQGFSSNSFAPGANTGLSVNAGNTVAAPASKEKMTLEEANGPLVGRPYTAVSKLPKFISGPPMETTPEAKEDKIVGTITVKLNLSADGHVTSVRVLKGLGYGLDENCMAAWKLSQWKPGEQDGVPVPVQDVPQKCTVVLPP